METGKAARFDTIVTVRENQKNQTSRELHQIARERVTETERLNDLHTEQQNAFNNSFKHHRTKASNMQVFSSFVKKLSSEITKQTTTVRKIETNEEIKREELSERVKAQTIVEKLQGKFREEFRKEVAHKEQLLTDSLNQRLEIKHP
jgi:flagellar export protein FliJ